MLIDGGCHCGNIRFRLDWTPDPDKIPARACGCSFCRKHGGVWTSCPTGSLAVEVTDGSRVSRYAFGTKTAEFLVCGICGAVPVATSDIAGRTYAVVNVNSFENVDAARLRRTEVDFEGEDAAERLARRARGWIPNVRLVPGRAA